MCCLTGAAPGWAVSTALLLVRIVVGVAFVLHGMQKFQNPAGPTGWMSGMENAPPGPVQALAPICEVGGGALLALGLLTRVGCLALVAVMVGALALHHIPHGDPF